MSDLIERQAAIDALEEPYKVLDTWTDEFAIGERMQWEKDVKALNSLPSAQPEQQWIPCSERLPDKPNVYTVTDSNDRVVRFAFTGTDSSREYWKRCAKAWMPLPTPYREVSEK